MPTHRPLIFSTCRATQTLGVYMNEYSSVQGDIFWALCAESGGRLSAHFIELVENFLCLQEAPLLSVVPSLFLRSNEPTAIASQRGVARLIASRS